MIALDFNASVKLVVIWIIKTRALPRGKPNLRFALQVIKTFHFHKPKYLFQRFRSHKHPFSIPSYDI